MTLVTSMRRLRRRAARLWHLPQGCETCRAGVLNQPPQAAYAAAMQAALRYVMGPAFIVLAVLVYRSPVGPTVSLAGLFVFAVLAAAWFGGAGPGFVTAVLATLAVPQLIHVNYPLLGGFLDLPRFLTFTVAGLVVGWWSYRRRVIEAALRESEERYALALNASDQGFWDWVVAGDKFYLSPRLVDLFGFPAGTTFTRRAEMFERLSMPDEDRAALLRSIAGHFAGKTAYLDMEFRIFVNGEPRWIHSQGLATRDASGKVVRWSGAARDVTASKQAAEALRNSERRYSLAMEASGDGHTDWDLRSGEHYISPRLLQICGYEPGTTFRDREEWVRRFPFHPEDRPNWEKAIAAHFAGRESHFKMELRILVRGEVRWTAFLFLSTRDAAGTPIRWTGSISDITEQKRAEEALRASEERISLAMKASEEGYIDCDVRTDRFITSDRMREIFEVPPGTRIAYRSDFNKCFRFYSDEDARAYDEMSRAVAVQGGPDRYEFEFRAVLPSGKVKWIWTRSNVTRDAEGRALRRVGVVADVTARKQAEVALRNSEERFARAVAGSSDGVWDIDLVGRSVYFSARTRELCGLPPGPEVMPLDGWFESLPLHPEDLPKRMAAVQAHLSGKAPAYDGEFRFLQPDGLYRWRHLHGVCVRDADGKPLRMAGSMSDVDARRRAEDALRESEERYSLAMAASESGYWDWHVPTNRYVISPRAYEMGGYDPDTYANRDDFRTQINMHPEDFAKWEAARKELFAGSGERLAMEVRYIVRGETRWHSLQAICKRDETGKVIRWTGSTTDVTERKRAEEGLKTMERKLRQAQRLESMGTLAGGIAHDFNNILGAVLGYGEMALRDAKKGSRLARDLDNIMVAGERGRALVDRVLAFSRSAVGERVPVHVERVVREVLDLVMAKLPESVTVHPKLHAGLAAVLGDATQVHQVVANLASNAIHAMPAGGTLRVELAVERIDAPRAATIGARAPGEYVVLTVADTGTGIAPEIVDRIFDPFFTTKEVGTGTGLGLSLVHGIVTELGGAIGVASVVGAGTTFTVYLPRSGDAAHRGDAKESALPRGDGQRVLIVDDEEPLVQLATRTLAELGYEAIGFTSSAAALAALRADPHRFDALITDERMPEMSGSALIREVRSVRDSMPVVVMSGYLGTAAAGEAAAAIGADEVLQKPLSARDLAASLARVLRN
jgi:PAS domain S-box-containing protein